MLCVLASACVWCGGLLVCLSRNAHAHNPRDQKTNKTKNQTKGNLFTSSHDRAFVETLNATQSPGSVTQDAWYAGTADAVRRYLGYLEANEGWEDVLILAGDQIYR